MSRDMMGAFELYQPDTVENAVELLGRFGEDGWALAGGNDSLDWFKDRIKRPKYVVDIARHRRAQGHSRDRRRRSRDRRAHDAHRSRAQRGHHGALQAARRRRTARREPADQELRHARRQRLSGRALLVLPLRRGLLSRGRQPLLRGHARRPEPRALPLGRGPLHRGEPVGYGAGARRARREDGGARPEGHSARCRPRSFSSARTSTSSG